MMTARVWDVRRQYRLAELLAGWVAVPAGKDRIINGLSLDSRCVQAGDLFLACLGQRRRGLDYVADAVRSGAVAVIYEGTAEAAPPAGVPAGVSLFPLIDLPRRVGEIAERYYGEPSRALRVIGVTGTNGKTSCTHFLAQALGVPCGVIGTLGSGVYPHLRDNGHTTPDAVSIHAMLAQWHDEGAAAVAMEVSSHGLDQGRVDGVCFDTAVFTNLTRDHLDYHTDMATYGEAKARLFARLGLRHAVINADDAYGARLLATLPIEVQAVSYGLTGTSGARQHIAGRVIALDLEGMSLHVDSPWGAGTVNARLLGRFNASNLLAVLGVLLVGGMSFEAAMQRLAQIAPVPGRMECYGGGAQPLVVVDYAHTPDALEQVLRALREHCAGRLWVVFGCGGDRDSGKRPLMGAAAESGADRVVLTHDNPRGEDPQVIIAGILAGLAAPREARVIPDRAHAIDYAVSHAGPGDVVLVAGKGHENYQIVGETRIPYSDCEQVRAALARRAS